MDVAVARFGPLVRKGLRYRRLFESAKAEIGAVPFEWYRYDSFPNLFYLQHLMNCSSLSLRELVGDRPVLDIGAADGALSFFWESLGFRVHAWDYSGSNTNKMEGIRRIAAHLGSTVQIRDEDLDCGFKLEQGQYGLVFFLGTLYHLKNPFYALETIARNARHCLLSTKVARLSADKRIRLENLPVAYLLESAECNGDVTNYFVFSPTGLLRLVRRTGWIVRAAMTSGEPESDPVSPQADERMYLLLESGI